MKRLMLLLLVGVAATNVFAQSDKCPFGGKGTSRNDQYSKSSAKNVKQSQGAMVKQMVAFNKPKYGYIVNAKRPKPNTRAQL